MNHRKEIKELEKEIAKEKLA